MGERLMHYRGALTCVADHHWFWDWRYMENKRIFISRWTKEVSLFSEIKVAFCYSTWNIIVDYSSCNYSMLLPAQFYFAHYGSLWIRLQLGHTYRQLHCNMRAKNYAKTSITWLVFVDMALLRCFRSILIGTGHTWVGKHTYILPYYSIVC